VIVDVSLFCLVLVLLPLSTPAQTSLQIITWNGNTPDANATLGVTSIRLGCSSTPDFCTTEMQQVASSQDVSRIYLSIQMNPNTSATYAAQFSQWSLTNPILFSMGFDDFVNRMEHLQTDFGVAVPGTVITDTLNATKSTNPNLKFHITMYEDQLSSPLLGDSNLPASTRAGVDYVQLYIHYRANGPNYAQYLQQTKALFPNAKIIAGAYAYDRIDYLPCLPGGVPCTAGQDANFFQQLFQIQLSELQQGLVDQIEFFPGYFGLEAQWPAWAEPRRCAATRLSACIANTLAMRQTVLQDFTAAFGAPGALTSLSPRPLVFPVQDVSTTSGASAVTLNNPGTAPLNIGSIAIAGGNAAEFSQQNSCPVTLAANTNCSINITFTPAAVGTRAAQLSVTDNARRSPHFMDLNGVGADSSSPQVLLSPTTLNFQNQTVGTPSAPLALLLSNPGGGDLTITSIVVTGSSASQFAQTNNCIAGVVPAGSCTINVTFTPATADNQSAQLVITDNAIGSPHTVPLQGAGSDSVSAEVNLSKTVLTFDSQIVNTAGSAQSVTLSNPGSTALTISGITIAGNNASDFSETNTCGTSLAAANACALTITFKPTGVGPRIAQAFIADNANGSPQSVTLNGTGAATPAPVASVSPGSVAFPSQTVKTTSSTVPVTLSNTGSAALAITSIAISGADAGDFTQTNTCGNSLAPATTCAVNLSFTPTTAGARFAQLLITDNATGSPQTVVLTGTGAATPAPVASVSPGSVAFPSQTVKTTSSTVPVTLSNTGSAALDITSIAISGAEAGDFTQTNTCGNSLAPATTCTVNLSFTPTTAGARSAQLLITDNATGSPQTVALTGTGSANTAPVATLSPTSLTFPSQTVQTTSSVEPVTLSNTGSAALTLISITISGANAADFTQTSTCGNNLPASANCTVNISFIPLAVGARTAQLQLIDNAPGSPHIVPLTGTGTVVATPAVTLTPASLNFPNQSVGVASSASLVILANTGNAALTISSIAVSGANASDFAQTNTCASTLAAAANCSISVVFAPAAPGPRSAQILITDNASGSPHQLPLYGIGVSVAAPDFSISVTPQSATLSVGQSTGFTLSVSASGGFGQPVTFACSGLPAGATCTFSPASVTPATNGQATTKLTLATLSHSTATDVRFPAGPSPLSYETALRLTVLCLLLCFYKFKLKNSPRLPTRPRLAAATAALLVLAAGSLAGCANSASSPPPVTGPTGTPAGAYAISVTASSGTLSHQLNLSITVQ
jgi:hypothetical protein